MSLRKPPLDTSMSFFLIQAILIICGFHICEFAYSLKFTVNPQKARPVALPQPFMNVCRAGQEFSCPVHIPAEAEQGHALPSCFCPPSVKVLFHSLFGVTFSHVCGFCWWFCSLKWPLSTLLKYCLEILSARKLHYDLWRKHMCSISFVQAWITILLARSSVLVTQQYLLNNINII